MVTTTNETSDKEIILSFGERTPGNIYGLQKLLPPNHVIDEDGNYWIVLDQYSYVAHLLRILEMNRDDPFQQELFFDVHRKKLIQRNPAEPIRICGASYDDQNIVFDVEYGSDYAYNEMHKN
jgi:hypothetical protein